MSHTISHIDSVMRLSVIEELMWDRLGIIPPAVHDRFVRHFSKFTSPEKEVVLSHDTGKFLNDIKAVLKNPRFSKLLSKDFVLDHLAFFLEIPNIGAFVDFLSALKKADHPVVKDIHQNFITEAAAIACQQYKEEVFEDLVKLVADDEHLARGILVSHVSLRSTSLLHEGEYSRFIYFYDTMTKTGFLPPHYNDQGINIIARGLVNKSASLNKNKIFQFLIDLSSRGDALEDLSFQRFADFGFKLNLAPAASPLKSLLLPALRSHFQEAAHMALRTKDYGVLCDLLDAAQETGDYGFIDLVESRDLQDAIADLSLRKNYNAIAKLIDACSKSSKHVHLLEHENHVYVVRRSKILAQDEKFPDMDVILSLSPQSEELFIYIGEREFKGLNSLRANWDSGISRTNAAEIVIDELYRIAANPQHPAKDLAMNQLKEAHPGLFVRR